MRRDEGQSPEEVRSFYNRFYTSGGWRYHEDRQKQILRDVVVAPAGWTAGSRVLEVGCGMGHHSKMLHDLGLRMTAVDLSEVGVEAAKRRYDGPEYVAADLREFEPGHVLDGVYVRGMSFFHYELLRVNKHGIDAKAETARMFSWLREGGTFALQILTDFSGRRPAAQVHHNRLSDYVRLFERFGEVLSLTDWTGTPLRDDAHARERGRVPEAVGVTVVTRKITGATT